MTKIKTSRKIISEDEMGTVQQFTITLPHHDDTNAVALTQQLSEAFEELNERREEGEAKSLQAAKKLTSSASDPSAPPLSVEYLFSRVTVGLAALSEELDNLPDHIRLDMERMLNIAFQAGSVFQIATARNKHLTDIKREAKNAKARSDGGKAKANLFKDENDQLFSFMDEALAGRTRFVKTAARWAAKQGLGAQDGDLEARTEANRQRYLNRENKKKSAKL